MDFSENRFSFMKWRALFISTSLLIIAFSLFEWFETGPEKYGVDFLGGAEVVVQLDKGTPIGEVRDAMSATGLGTAIVQEFKNNLGEPTGEFSIRVKSAEGADTPEKVVAAMRTVKSESFDLRKEDYVGPTIGEEIREAGLTAMALALVGMLIYISLRFEWRFAVGALFALVHDVLITIGIYILCGKEISAAVLAALLTIIGYSLNDTIVVFDRVRENIIKARKKGGSSGSQAMKIEDFLKLIDSSITQTLSRTLLTSLTTLFVVTTLWLFGGGAVADLAFTLVIGVVVGTYSSIFIACPAVVLLENFVAGREAAAKAKKLKPKEAAAS